MTASPNTRRKIAPAAAMVLATFGAIALLVTFVMQVVSEAPPRGTDEIRAKILTQIEESTQSGAPGANGKVRPETLEVIDRTSEGVVAYAFLTTADELGYGIQAGDGGGLSFTTPGEQTGWMQAMLPGSESTRDYELAVRRSGSGSGYEHTFTAK